MRAAGRIAVLRELMAAQGLDAVVVRSNTDLQWLTGFEGVFDSEEAHTALVTQGSCIIHTDSRYASAFRAAASQEGLWAVDDQRIQAADFLAWAAAEAGVQEKVIAIDEMTPLALYRRFVEKLPSACFAERGGDILRLRSVKEQAEVEKMVRAQEIASQAFLEVVEGLRPGMTEEEVALSLEFAMRSRGAQELAFPSIVASGPNSANPHAIPGRRQLQKGDLVVIDFGARFDGYRSDTTRTVSIGKPSPEQERIYNTVLAANCAVREAARPGVTGREMHELAESILAEAGYAGKMGHGLGHGVGLDIHEVPVLNPRNDQPLPEGAIVTVEPGIYLEGSDGVRIEDCGQLTADGFMNFCGLTHDLLVVE